MPGMSLGIDLGTANVTIYASGQGIVLREPSVIAVDSKTGQLIACGQEAFDMLGRTPDSIQAIRPLSKGVISEFDYAERMLRTFVRRVCAYKVLKPRVAVSVPALVTEVEQRSVVEAVQAAGTRKPVLIEESVAAAIGAGLNISDAMGAMVVDMGAGTTDIAVMSLKGLATSRSVRIGGNDMDEAIVRYMHNKYNHIIGLRTAEQVKIQIGCAVLKNQSAADVQMGVKGRNAVTGLPCVQTVTAREIHSILNELLQEIYQSIQTVLEYTPPELAGDILTGGICLTGGIAQLLGIAEGVSAFTKVPAFVAQDPMDCVAKGTGKALKYVGIISDGIYDVSRLNVPLSDSSRL